MPELRDGPASSLPGNRTGATVREVKSPTTPRRNNASRRCIKYNLQFVTHNVRGIQTPQKREQLVEWAKSQNIYAMCMQETWIPAQDKTFSIGDHVIINHGIQTAANGRTRKGVAILLSPIAYKSWIRSGSIMMTYGDRVIAIELKLPNKHVARIISGYAPDSSYSETDRVHYQDSLHEAIAA